MPVIHLNKKDFFERVADKNSDKFHFIGNKPTIIDFYAEWCGPCKSLSPTIEELSNEYDGQLDFFKVDVDADSDLANMFNIRSVPSLMFIHKDGTFQIKAGAMSKILLEDDIRKILDVKKRGDSEGAKKEGFKGDYAT